MSTPSQSSFSPFFELLCQLASAHGLARPESADDIREFTFKPGGASYRITPQPQDGTQGLLEIDIMSLEAWLEGAAPSDAVERLLRTLLQLNPVLQDKSDWLISLDAQDLLMLSTPLPLISTSAEAVQMLALEGLERARAIDDFCQGSI